MSFGLVLSEFHFRIVELVARDDNLIPDNLFLVKKKKFHVAP